jgi:hypothetical protein
VQLVNAVVQYTGITAGKIRMCCDRKAALSRCTWKQHHVKGHQDIFLLKRNAALNDEMDQKCKKFWEEGPVSELADSIRKFCAILRATKYWENKLGDKHNEIDWTSLGYAISIVPRS